MVKNMKSKVCSFIIFMVYRKRYSILNCFKLVQSRLFPSPFAILRKQNLFIDRYRFGLKSNWKWNSNWNRFKKKIHFATKSKMHLKWKSALSASLRVIFLLYFEKYITVYNQTIGLPTCRSFFLHSLILCWFFALFIRNL